jgi:elongation factor Ts
MAEITASMAKELRERTGAGMMDCKKALVATEGDMEAAVDWLRTKGLAAAAKKAGRAAAEGLVGVAGDATRAAVVEVNSETDFVAKNEQFQAFVTGVAQVALNAGGDRDAILGAQFPGGSATVADQLTANIAKIGEQQAFRRAAVVEVSQGVVARYVHNAAGPTWARSACWCAGIDCGRGCAERAGPRHRHARGGHEPAGPERRRCRSGDAGARARDRGREGRGAGQERRRDRQDGGRRGSQIRVREQPAGQVYVRDGKAKVADVIAAEAKKLGADVKLTKFVRFQVGEGIEKAESDFAAEVAAAAGVQA